MSFSADIPAAQALAERWIQHTRRLSVAPRAVLHRPVGEEYIRDLKATQRALGRIDPTGCPEGGIGF